MPPTDTTYSDIATLPFYQISDPYALPKADEVNTGVPLDSIFRPCDSVETVHRQSLFTGHKLAPQHSTLQERHVNYAPAWLFAVIIGLCIALCVFYRSRKMSVQELFKSVFANHITEIMSHGNMQGMAMLSIVLFLSSALGLTVWHLAMRHTGVVGYFGIVAALTIAYLLRNGVLSALAAVFDSSQAMTTYQRGNFLYHLLLATAVTPLLFLLIYLPGADTVTAIIIGVLTAVVFLIRMVRGSKLFLTNTKGHSFFLFYYLCTVEIVPYLVAIWWIISQ